jgi:ADP-ribosylglycohydrolase
MALVIAETAATGADLRGVATQDAIVGRWADWATDARDVGSQTREVLAAAPHGTAAALVAAREPHERTGHTAGNGPLMRTAPVALAFLDDPVALTQAATAISALTHYDREAGEAGVLWCHAIRHAVLTGALDARVGLQWLPPASRDGWASRFNQAERSQASEFTRNGWAVQALPAAWCAIAATAAPEDDPATGEFRAALQRAHRLRRELVAEGAALVEDLTPVAGAGDEAGGVQHPQVL